MWCDEQRSERLRLLAEVTNSIEWSVAQADAEAPLFASALAQMAANAAVSTDEYEWASRLGEGAFAVADLYVHRRKPQEQRVVKQMKDKCARSTLSLRPTHAYRAISRAVCRMMVANQAGDERLEAVSEKERFRFVCEGVLHSLLDHENVVRCFGCIVDQHDGQIQMPKMLLELCSEGTLLEQLNKPKYPTMQALRWLRQIAAGMEYLHGLGILHRDLKPENVLLSGGVAKVADLSLFRLEASLPSSNRSNDCATGYDCRSSVGSSAHTSPAIHARARRQLESCQVGAVDCALDSSRLSLPVIPRVELGKTRSRKMSEEMTLMTGTPRYMAPEAHEANRCDKNHSYSNKLDVFSFAILMFELLERKRAYSAEYLTMEQVAKGVATRQLRPQMPKCWSRSVKALVGGAWAQMPEQRPSFSELIRQLDELIEAAGNSDDGASRTLGLKQASRSLIQLMRFSSSSSTASS